MNEVLYDIYFSGQILEGEDLQQVKQEVGAIFKADGERLERLFSGTPVRVKAGVDQDTAIKYRVTFRQAGAIIEVKPAGEAATSESQPASNAPQADTKTSEANEEASGLTVLPPNTGSLIDCVVEEEPTPIGDISYMSLDPEGTDIDETEPPPPLDIDTSKLKLDSE